MEPAGIKDRQEMMADLDLTGLRGTRVNLESATA